MFRVSIGRVAANWPPAARFRWSRSARAPECRARSAMSSRTSLGQRGTGGGDEAQRMHGARIRPRLRLLQHREAAALDPPSTRSDRARRTIRTSSTSDGIGRKRDAAPGQQRRHHRGGDAVRIVNRRNAEAAILRGQRVPGLQPRRSRQHVAVTERHQVRIGGRSRGVQDEGRRIRIGIVERCGGSDLRHSQLHGELAVARKHRRRSAASGVARQPWLPPSRRPAGRRRGEECAGSSRLPRRSAWDRAGRPPPSSQRLRSPAQLLRRWEARLRSAHCDQSRLGASRRGSRRSDP